MAIVPVPRTANPLLRWGVWLSERMTGRVLEPARLLAWYPKAAIGFGVMESLVAHREGRLTARVLQMVRLTASLAVNCAFCIDMNGADRTRNRVTDDEVRALAQLASGLPPIWPATVTDLERIAATYAAALSATPAILDTGVEQAVTQTFSPREIVVLATTAAQVNAWARLIRGLDVPPAGFSDTCQITSDRPGSRRHRSGGSR